MTRCGPNCCATESVFLIGEEIGVFEGSYKITAGLLAEFGPERVVDTPISEEGFVGAAIGAAMLGMRPVVEIMTINFSLLAINQIVNHAAKMHAMFGGQVSVPGDPHPGRRRTAAGRDPLAEHGGLVRARARHEGGRTPPPRPTPRRC